MDDKTHLIYANELIRIIENATCTSSDGSVSLDEIRNFINSIPKVDAVEVVRCKNCDVWEHREDGLINCPYCTDLKQDDDFCSCGDRKRELYDRK